MCLTIDVVHANLSNPIKTVNTYNISVSLIVLCECLICDHELYRSVTTLIVFLKNKTDQFFCSENFTAAFNNAFASSNKFKTKIHQQINSENFHPTTRQCNIFPAKCCSKFSDGLSRISRQYL